MMRERQDREHREPMNPTLRRIPGQEKRANNQTMGIVARVLTRALSFYLKCLGSRGKLSCSGGIVLLRHQ